jgi:phosphoglycolate phosphatase-like HAD superfamily hydrolase
VQGILPKANTLKRKYKMSIKVIVFDFDGTLIDSNLLKYDAYFKLFQLDEHHTRTIREVLSKIYEQSRFVILEEIVRRLNPKDESELSPEVNELAERYNDIVLAGAKICPQMPGAKSALKSLSRRYRLYVSSTTPDSALKEIIRYRGWYSFFEDIFGYPHQKTATLKNIIAREMVQPTEVLVIGDGESDRISALQAGCAFVHVNKNFRLKDLENVIAGL